MMLAPNLIAFARQPFARYDPAGRGASGRRTGRPYRHAAGFTFLEAIASVVLLGLLFTGLWLALSQTVDAVARSELRQRALRVAERHMEELIVSNSQPSSGQTGGLDEIDPEVAWEMTFEDEVFGEIQKDVLPTALTKVAITAWYEGAESEKEATQVVLTRYFQPLAPATLMPPTAEKMTPQGEPDWLAELRQSLGREPTLQELLDRMLRQGEIPPALVKQLEEFNREQQQKGPQPEPAPREPTKDGARNDLLPRGAER